MKKLTLFVAAVSLMAACTDPETNNEVLRLNQEKHELIRVTADKDSTISAYIESLNDIQESLSVIKEKERIITVNSNDPEFQKGKAQEVISDIESIYSLLENSRERLANLQSELKASNNKVGALQKELERMMEQMNQQLEAKDGEIKMLRATLRDLNADFDVLMAEYEMEVEKKRELAASLNTAYYAIGTKKELKAAEVIGKTGGFAGIGGSQQLDENFNRDYFTQIDITKVNEVPLNGGSADMLTNHPDGSYEWEGEEKERTKLIITDSEQFWSVSKYLVIIAE